MSCWEENMTHHARLISNYGYVQVEDKYDISKRYWAKVIFDDKVEWEKVVTILKGDIFNENLPLNDIYEYHKVNINDIVFDKDKVTEYVPKMPPVAPDWEFYIYVSTSFKAFEVLRELESIGFKFRGIDSYTLWGGGMMYVKNGVISDKPVDDLEEWMPSYLDWKLEVKYENER